MKSDPADLQRILAQPNHGNEDLQNLVELAADVNCVECAELAFNAGAKPESEALFMAVNHGSSKMARFLIDKGVDVPETIRMMHNESDITFLNQINNERSRDRARTTSEDKPAVAPSPVSTQSDLAPHFHEVERPNNYALIIGVEKYDNLPAATYAERDAATAAEFIRALGVPARNIVTLTGSHATRSSMVKQLENWLSKNVDETSTVYFYFSGHGAPDPVTGQAYLIPFDGDPQYLAETAYPLKRLYLKLTALRAKRTIVMIDSCFSGMGGRSVLAKGSRPLVNNVDTGLDAADGNIAVLTASGANQISGSKDEEGHGLFTYYLFSGLDGAAKDGAGRVTLQSLFDYLKPRVMDDSRRANGDQTPEFRADPASHSAVLR